MTFTQVPVTATYEDSPGVPSEGVVLLQLTGPMVRNGVIKDCQIKSVTLDSSGSISTTFEATNEPDTFPEGGSALRVTELIVGQNAVEYVIEVPYDAVSVDLATAPHLNTEDVPAPAQLTQTVNERGLPGGVATLDISGLIPASQIPEGQGGGGGAVSTVNGQTGDVIITAGSIGALTQAAGDARYSQPADVTSEIDAEAEVLQTQIDVLQTSRRRRDYPPLHVIREPWPNGHATITTAEQAGTTISNGVLIAPLPELTGNYTYLGAAGFTFGSVAPDTNFVLPSSKTPGGRGAQQGWSLQCETDADVIELGFKFLGATLTSYRLTIDGRRITDEMQDVGGATVGEPHVIKFDFGSRKVRKIRFDFYQFPFRGFYLPPYATVNRIVVSGPRLAVLGDSYSDGSDMALGGSSSTWAHHAAQELGYEDVWMQSKGGTGYITAGTSEVFLDRVDTDITPYTPDEVWVAGGYSDNLGDQGEIGDAAAAVFSAIQTGLPDARLVVVGPFLPTGSPGAPLIATDATLKQKALDAGAIFISPYEGAVYQGSSTALLTAGPLITGTGNTSAPNSTGNADWAVGSDGVHYTDEGHLMVGRKVASLMRASLEA